MPSKSNIDKFGYFDSILATTFNLSCHYGCLEVILASLDIPVLPNSPSNLYIVKLKEGAHSNQVLVQAPNQILDKSHQFFYSQTQSINERVYIQFYQVMSESAFDPAEQKGAQQFENLKLIYQKTIPIKHIPFNEEENVAKNYPIVFNLPSSMTGGI
jgi:hypothetical protein